MLEVSTVGPHTSPQNLTKHQVHPVSRSIKLWLPDFAPFDAMLSSKIYHNYIGLYGNEFSNVIVACPSRLMKLSTTMCVHNITMDKAPSQNFTFVALSDLVVDKKIDPTCLIFHVNVHLIKVHSLMASITPSQMLRCDKISSAPKYQIPDFVTRFLPKCSSIVWSLMPPPSVRFTFQKFTYKVASIKTCSIVARLSPIWYILHSLLARWNCQAPGLHAPTSHWTKIHLGASSSLLLSQIRQQLTRSNPPTMTAVSHSPYNVHLGIAQTCRGAPP